MAKFKNTTGFNQVVLLAGKKRVVRNNWVIEAHDEFIQVGFEKVPDDTPVTTRPTSSKVVNNADFQVVIDELNNRIEELEDRFNTDETLSQIEAKIQSVSEQALELGDGASKDLQELRDLVGILNESLYNQGMVVKDLKNSDDTILKRLEILKTAMQAMELQIDEVIGYEDDLGN